MTRHDANHHHFGRAATTFAPDLLCVVVGAPPKWKMGVAK